MTNSRFRNNGQPINIAVAIRRAGKHENDVDAVVAEQGGGDPPPCIYIGVLVTIDQNGRRGREEEGGEAQRHGRCFLRG